MTYRGLGNGYRLLIVLHEADGELQAGQLRRAIKNYDTAKNVAKDLKAVGLVEIKVVRKPKLTHIYTLTEKGKDIASQLAAIDASIREGIEDVDEEE